MIENELAVHESLADLADHPGYKAVLDRVQAEIDTLADKMEDSSSKKKEVFFLANWRALRTVQRFLLELPANSQNTLAEAQKQFTEAEQLGYAHPEIAENRSRLHKFPSYFGTMETEEE